MDFKTINLGQAANFFTDEHFKSFKKDLPNKTVGELITQYAEKYPEKAKVLYNKPMPQINSNRKPEPEPTPIEDVLERMYNWKQESALDIAKEIKDFPKEALKKLEYLSEKFGNCGFQDGSMYNELIDTNFEVAKMLGYEYDEEEDYYLPIKNK